MKPRLSNQPTNALTRVEVIVVIATLAVLFVLLLPALVTHGHNGRQKIRCINDLKQVGIAYRLWEGNHNDKYPMQVSVTNGGAMELVGAGNVAACFQAMSNELYMPKILLCPADTRRVLATNWSTLNNSNISYFVGLDADESKPQMLLSGDDNFAIGGVPVKPGLLQLLTNTPVAWTKTRHKLYGNIGLADGSVQQLTTDGLRQAFQQTGVATNRLVIP
jgi:prepilin-type processing-associated H-X9-DG protein